MTTDDREYVGLKSRAMELDAELRARADEMEEVRRLPADVAAKMAKAALFRMVLPSSVGGLQLSPREIVETIEILSRANASAGWCAMIAATTAINAAYMDPEFAKDVYGNDNVITGGVFAPMGRARPEADGYRVSGRWQWGSGSANCTWLCGGCFIEEENGLRLGPDGSPENRMMIFPSSDAELIDTWQVAGLKGTGSGDIAVKDIFVPSGRSVSLTVDKPKVDGALYKFPVFGLLSMGVSAVAMGNARGALDAVTEFVKSKSRSSSRRTLADKSHVQSEVAQLEARWRSARAYLMDEIEVTWRSAQENGAIPVKRRADLRLACTHMTRTCADICRATYDMGGGAALFLNNDLQRRFRDAHAITQHIVTSRAIYELTGRVILDRPANESML